LAAGIEPSGAFALSRSLQQIIDLKYLEDRKKLNELGGAQRSLLINRWPEKTSCLLKIKQKTVA